jgi:hypothetical protein
MLCDVHGKWFRFSGGWLEVVVSCSVHISTYLTKFISEPVLDGMLGCSTVGYCLVFVSHSVHSGHRFFCLVTFTACDSDGSGHNNWTCVRTL